MNTPLDPKLIMLASDFTVRDCKAARDTEQQARIAEGSGFWKAGDGRRVSFGQRPGKSETG
jgi:hypothetical protein